MAPSRRLSPVSSSKEALPFDQSILKRRYALEKRLAENKAVFLAWDSREENWVVVKQATQKWAIDRLSQETTLLRTLNHPRIPRFVDAFWLSHGAYVLVEEWKPGEPMSQQQLALDEVIWIGQHLCEVLSYLHTGELIHRDIKPDNVLIEQGKAVYVIDFDCAARMTDPWLKQWTIGYSAPEQYSQGMIHPPADIYSLGMLLGCALTGAQPETVLRARFFSGLYGDLSLIPEEKRLLLDLLDRAIARRPVDRPLLGEIRQTLDHLSHNNCSPLLGP